MNLLLHPPALGDLSFEFIHSVGELVGEQPQVLAIKLRGGGNQDRYLVHAEHLIHGEENLLRRGGLCQVVDNAASPGQGISLRPLILGGIENYGRACDQRVSTKLADEFEAVHPWHEDIGDDQRGVLGLHQF